MKKQARGALLIIAASFGFGVMPSLALNAYEGGINVMTMLSLKYLLVCVLMIPLAVFRYRIHRLAPRTIGRIFALSATLYTAQATLYAFSVTLIPVALAALILFTYPILVSVIGALFFHERMTMANKIWLGAAFGGLVLLFAGPMESMHPLGVAAAAAASLSYAVYVLLIGRLTEGMEAPVTNTILNGGAAFSVLIISALTGQLHLGFTAVTWLYILYNALFVGIIAYWMWLVGLKHLGAVKASVLSMTEPVFAALASLVLLGQRLSNAQWLGGGILLVSITMFVYSQQRDSPVVAAAEGNR